MRVILIQNDLFNFVSTSRTNDTNSCQKGRTVEKKIQKPQDQKKKAGNDETQVELNVPTPTKISNRSMRRTNAFHVGPIKSKYRKKVVKKPAGEGRKKR